MDQKPTSFSEQKRVIGRAAKERFAKDNNLPGFENLCLFCFTGANQIKKNIGAMVDAFQLLDSPETALLLALKPVECQIGTYKYHGEYELHEFVSHPHIFVINNPLADEAHAEIFRMADFLLYPSQGEAPGLQMAEAQLCGCIPIATDYTGLPEESCFEEFLIRDYTLLRGQFGCYRAIVSAEILAKKMSDALDFWKGLQGTLPKKEGCLPGPEPTYVARYERFMRDVQMKFRERTWANTAHELASVLESVVNGGLRVDLELQRL